MARLTIWLLIILICLFSASPISGRARVSRSTDVFQCPESYGDHPVDKEQCSTAFYKCEGWEAQKLHCNDGEAFDPNDRSCRPLEDIPECRFDCSGKPDDSQHAIGCSRYRWWCSDGDVVKLQCSVDMYFNPDKGHCDSRENVALCNAAPTETTSTMTSSTGLPNAAQQHQFECTGKADGSTHSFGCSRFYWWCWNGHGRIWACSVGYYFNPRSSRCDHRENVEACNGRSDFIVAAAEPPGSTTVGPSQGAIDCTALPDGNYPHPTNSCSDHYFTCSNYVLFKMPCPPLLAYDSTSDQCRLPEDVPGCSKSSTEKLHLGYGNAHKEDDQISAVACSYKADGHYPVAICSIHYYTCSNNIASRMSCPFGLYFHAESEECRNRAEVPGCVDEDHGEPMTSSMPSSTSTSTPVVSSAVAPASANLSDYCKQRSTGFYYPHPSDCKQYLKCTDQGALVFHCPLDLVFNQRLNVCDHRSNVPECFIGTPDSSFCDGKEDGRYPVPDSECTSDYIFCNWGTTKYQQCVSPLKFHPSTLTCEWTEDVPGCADITGARGTTSEAPQPEHAAEGDAAISNDTISPESIIQPPSEDQDGQGETIHDTKSTISDTQAILATTDPPPALDSMQQSASCLSLSDGDYALGPCARSYQECLDGYTRFQECPAGQVFNDATKLCEDRESLVQCADQSQHTTAFSADLTTTTAPIEHQNQSAMNSSAFTCGADFCTNLPDGYYAIAPCSPRAINCSNGLPAPLWCNAGHVFDAQVGQCRPEESVPLCKRNLQKTNPKLRNWLRVRVSNEGEASTDLKMQDLVGGPASQQGQDLQQRGTRKRRPIHIVNHIIIE